MALIGGGLAALILDRYDWHDLETPRDYKARTKLETLFGPTFWDQIRGRTVIDFGCGYGDEAIEIARQGAARVIGLELRDEVLAIARANQASAGVKNCTFAPETDVRADLILSIDSFEHFDHPGNILATMARLLRPDGRVMISFGPPWYHPNGGHLPLFPWAHLLLTERSLMRWRSKYKTDGARHFREMAGGLNQMSIRRFERLVARSALMLESLETRPIRAVRRLHCRLTREFFTSIVRGTLVSRVGRDPVRQARRVRGTY